MSIYIASLSSGTRSQGVASRRYVCMFDRCGDFFRHPVARRTVRPCPSVFLPRPSGVDAADTPSRILTPWRSVTGASQGVSTTLLPSSSRQLLPRTAHWMTPLDIQSTNEAASAPPLASCYQATPAACDHPASIVRAPNAGTVPTDLLATHPSLDDGQQVRYSTLVLARLLSPSVRTQRKSRFSPCNPCLPRDPRSKPHSTLKPLGEGPSGTPIDHR
ncbi:hypothetical protein K466DRAFT_278684 [Polyporus arcularius HHB13444]|uniref:Uncharacterized protein n=1 Tax=Polyporus arcularius HHB13444 TaxID=1314778 RepID=A0A5C3PR45_9APHY|nr:hypothetical protein K466DRAFT_278684 [Polyporus arcularius HHB13444]